MPHTQGGQLADNNKISNKAMTGCPKGQPVIAFKRNILRTKFQTDEIPDKIKVTFYEIQ